MPSFPAHSCAVFLLRDEIATISMSFDFSMPGMTLATPMFAVEMMPHFDVALPVQERMFNPAGTRWEVCASAAAR